VCHEPRLSKINLCVRCDFFVLVVIPDFTFTFFLLDQKETKNQGCRKIAKIYYMPLRRISILAAFVFQSANAMINSLLLLKIFAA
jgi:hypothetical protein